MKSGNRKFIIIITVIGLCTIAFLGIRSYVFSKIGLRVDEKINSLNLSGFNVRYESLTFNWRKNLIEIRSLSFEKNAYDTACIYPEFISAGVIQAEGLSLFPLIFRNTLSFDRLYLDRLRVVMRKDTRLFSEQESANEEDFRLNISRSTIKSAEFTYTDSVNCTRITEIKSDVTIDGLAMAFLANQPLAWEMNSLTIDRSEVSIPQELYTFKIKQAVMDFSGSRFRADSIRVIPDAGKIEFGRIYGAEIDRFDALIPFVELQDLHLSFRDSAKVHARMAEVQFYLKVFRDKRQPFVKIKKLLPVAQLQDLPFALSLDSIKVRKSYVEYEEYAEGAVEPGKVFFDNLYASLYNIDNRAKTGDARLRAQANLMGHGNIDLFVTFPLEKKKSARLSGAIADFRMEEINAILTPTTNIKVESGKMEALTFSFVFDEMQSNGELELQYQDLKLAIFKDDEEGKDVEPEKDNLKTFIMNTFIFRKNMDEDVPEDKRTGTIAYVRDDNRSVFNFWVKSVVSGIKSAYNLDKAEAKVDEREARKEERLSKREGRRAKRTEKKKERG
jgi:hypothetical protein